MQNIKLSLTIEEANLVLEALGTLPFKKVFALIGKIQQQAGEQLGDNIVQAQPNLKAGSTPDKL